MITRRAFFKGLGALFVGGAGLAGYAFGIEPLYRLSVTRYPITPRNWPEGLKLKFAIIADIHANEFLMPPQRIEEIVAVTNGLGADAVLLLGDYEIGRYWYTKRQQRVEWAPVLAQLKAPLGVHAVLGNHDWWDDRAAQRARKGPAAARLALEKVGIPVYENDVVRLVKDGMPFWLSGTDSIVAIRTGRPGHFEGRDNLAAALAAITDDAPVIHMAHEPDLFTEIPARVSLTVSGHTHGGQVRLFGWSPLVPSAYGNRFAWGHIVEDGRHLVVSGGLGCSIMPVRFGMPPEITLLELG